MPFNPNIPQATDRLAKSQQDLLNNNQQLDTSFGVNHYAFSDLSANNGMHKYVQLVNQSVIPPGLVNGSETLYAKTTTGIGELYFTRGNGGTEIQMTNRDPLVASSGYTFLPGALLILWGNTSFSGGTSASINFTSLFGFTLTAIYSVTGTPQSASDRTLRLNGGITTNGFTFTTDSNSNGSVYWIVIGKRT